MRTKLSNKKYEEIKQIVTNLFIHCNISSVPISGFDIASKLGIEIYPYSSVPIEKRTLLMKKSEDGFSVETIDQKWTIYFNDKKINGRINNTIMHEIGHIILDHSEDSTLAEKEVKFFAKYALAPPVLIHKFQLDNSLEIANRFEISDEAARYALSYYKKWLKYGNEQYTEYEKSLIRLFEDNSKKGGD